MSLGFSGLGAPHQRGSSLIEVLVALVILALSGLGMAALLSSALRVNQSAYLRSQASFLAQDIAERMRANRAGVLAGHYDKPTSALNPSCAMPGGCNAAQMAAHDVAHWQAAVLAVLPAGTAMLCLDASPEDGGAVAPGCDGLGDRHAAKLWWDEDRDGVAEQRLVLSIRL